MTQVSQDRGLFSASVASLKLWAKSLYGLRDLVRKPFDQLRWRLLSAAVMNLQSLALRDDCRPDIAMRKPFPHFPALAQDPDFSCGIDPSNEMNAPSRDRQVGRERVELLPGQSLPSDGAVGLGRRQPLQGW